ncbi:phytoene dehydrogenase-like protein [Aurantimicrobium minutum]|uniref:phytoene desaturase family protein n=1 Tax=Aurantimicrobium minutum TaxID=708131 RepID=UPI0024768D80|nr:NAD(P)/FAD-dependent oxidoreductase [Aurantimicrobium minutum]MDH6532154.1 phytoene dehydrogenase-like protein [Aurantimicrobium minutum]
MSNSHYDVVIVGGGHNGLTAAAYLAQTGRSVLVLERSDHLGGAAISAQAFDGVDARLSRYSYLVSLLPQKIISDLGLDVKLIRRRYSSYTPLPGNPELGLLVDNQDAAATASSFSRIGEAADAAGFEKFYAKTITLAQALWPSVTEPLVTRSEAKKLVGDDTAWDEFIERPLGEVIERDITGEIARGVAFTDGIIGTFSASHDESLDQNRCFLYHVIGGATGDWDVPVGGMGAVTGEMARAAREAGAGLLTEAEVTALVPAEHSGGPTQVFYSHEGTAHEVSGTWVLANVSPWVLAELLGENPEPSVRPEGAQVKVNLLLKRLPKLADSTVTPEQAFGGTFHINETYSQLQTAFDEASSGRIPSTLPCEIYCHSLSDPSILGPDLRASGAHTLTVFGIHAPHSLVTRETNDDVRAQLQAAVLRSLNSVLAEPIEDVLMRDSNGELCVETKTTLDLEDALGMTGGNIFHGLLSWPWVEDDEDLSSPAARWGVATANPGILLCGSGARRGGAVSGIGGHNAAMAVLES